MSHISFDTIGNIAVINAPFLKADERKKLKKKAQELLKRNKNIKSIFVKSKISGKLRIPKLSWLAGKKDSKTIYKEHGCLMKLDIKTCYFSPRLSTDRLEIAKKIKKGKVLVMFSGIAPYPIIIAKYSKAKKIYAIELGREASRYAQENIKLNKIKNIVLIQGDVKKIVPKLARRLKFDAIVMARPQLKETFLKEAFLVSKKGTMIYYYDFQPKKFMHETLDTIEREAKKANKKIKILEFKRVREIAPYKYHIRIDFKIL
ncbi:MAG: hypothetical protein QW625_03270 [Candidatus Nanoarchaeia archaeon]